MATLSPIEIYSLARRAGFSRDHEEAVIATAIAQAESSGNPRAHNPVPPDDSFGLWQINMIGTLGPARRQQFGIASNDELFEPLTNARAAHSVFSTSERGFRQWSTFVHNAHEVHLGAARQAAEQAETTGLVAGLVADVEVDITEAELRRVVNEETTRVLDSQAIRVSGITSWERYLEVVLEAARKH
jgi:Lysozyme like domain